MLLHYLLISLGVHLVNVLLVIQLISVVPGWRPVIAAVVGQLFLTSMVIQFYPLTRNTLACYHIFVVQTSQLRGPICILLIISRIEIVLAIGDALSRKWWQVSLMLLSSHLLHNVLMVLPVKVRNLGKSDLISTVLIFQIIEIILASSDYIDGIVMSRGSDDAIISYADQVG